MSLIKSKCWHSNNFLHFLKHAVPLQQQKFFIVLSLENEMCWIILPLIEKVYKDNLKVMPSISTFAPLHWQWMKINETTYWRSSVLMHRSGRLSELDSDQNWILTSDQNWIKKTEFWPELNSGQKWIVTRTELWPEMNSDQNWILARTEFWQELNSDQNWILTRNEFWPELNSDQNWILTRTEFWLELNSDQNWILTRTEFWPELNSDQNWILTRTKL